MLFSYILDIDKIICNYGKKNIIEYIKYIEGGLNLMDNKKGSPKSSLNNITKIN